GGPGGPARLGGVPLRQTGRRRGVAGHGRREVLRPAPRVPRRDAAVRVPVEGRRGQHARGDAGSGGRGGGRRAAATADAAADMVGSLRSGAWTWRSTVCLSPRRTRTRRSRPGTSCRG